MRLAISNIAWDKSEDEVIAKLLQRTGVDAIDVAPSKYFPNPANTHINDIITVRKWWEKKGVEITGMQALLFGTTGLNIFNSGKVQNAMLAYLTEICRIGSGLGATRLVFGSPKNRDRAGLTNQETMDIAIPFFRNLGNVAESYNVLVCLEPNPLCYGANFMITSIETALVVKAVAHPAIKMQLDTGALTINNEDINTIVHDYAHLIGHIHASEPNLLPLGDGGTDHMKVYKSIIQSLPKHIVSIEMLATKNEPHEISIERSLNLATKYYRNNRLENKI